MYTNFHLQCLYDMYYKFIHTVKIFPAIFYIVKDYDLPMYITFMYIVHHQYIQCIYAVKKYQSVKHVLGI